MRNEFIRCGLTDGRVRKIKEEAENDVTVRSDQDLLLKQCNDYINEREERFQALRRSDTFFSNQVIMFLATCMQHTACFF